MSDKDKSTLRGVDPSKRQDLEEKSLIGSGYSFNDSGQATNVVKQDLQNDDNDD